MKEVYTMFKKICALLIAVVAVAMLMVPAFATNKSDLLTEAAKSPVYKYVKAAVENAARTIEITDEQAAQILPFIQRFNAAITEDKGATAATKNGMVYTEEQVNEVFACIDGVCAVLGYTYELYPIAKPAHAGDQGIKVYNEAGKLVFQFDGDAVADTDAASTSVAIYAVLASVLLAAGAVVLTVSKKRIAE